ncbi:protein CREG2 [Passer montanus]|uniref:protein CREG2 n=1 Tax=Passer montanus TaxID=9160 RepID=UPI00195F6C7D|nr:protein CREG2 [Passer montanus]
MRRRCGRRRRPREGGAAPGRAGTARGLARRSAWGFVATRAARGKIQGMPYGNCLLLSDGPVNNSTGIPFFYVTPKDNTVTDLLKNPMASLTLPEADGNFCRKNVIDPEDPRCARLTLMGQMVTVPPEEVEFAKQAMFSRHPVVRKWPRSYEWFFMKMNIEHIWLQSWYGEISPIAVEEYLKAVPNKG